MSPISNMSALISAAVVLAVLAANAAEPSGPAEFRQQILPVLEQYCFDCHGDGAAKGNVAFDEFNPDHDLMADRELWSRALKNLRAGLMPPQKKSRPTLEEQARLEQWIKRAVFAIDPQDPDPGRVTLRRLNRVEYQNTIRDLLGVNFEAQRVFPPDDTGHGFDNIADVLTLPPMLLEKYVSAAEQLIHQSVPTVAKLPRERSIPGTEFQGAGPQPDERGGRSRRQGALLLPFYSPAQVTNFFKADLPGQYQIAVALLISKSFADGVTDSNRCRLSFRVNGKEVFGEEFRGEGGRIIHHQFEADWAAGTHELSFELQPLTPDEPQTRRLAIQITSVEVRGPMAQERWVATKDYARFFPRPVPADAVDRRAYARELLNRFARRAFRRPPDKLTLDRLVNLAEDIYRQPGETFEAGVAQAMVAVLASPRFLFREDRAEPLSTGSAYPNVDEFSLAARLSYFLWSSTPDDELLRLAEAGQLRKNLSAQVDRLLKDNRSGEFIRNFVGQWLHARDIENVPIEARFVLAREEASSPEAVRRARPGSRQPLRAELSPQLRRDMRLETEKSFDYILRENRSLLELLDCDYAFLNERLARHYGIRNVSGESLRRVELAADSPRGGILTQGTVLGVTSNPTRTSPVKRGLFILENVLGTPPPPPPPDIPALEDAAKAVTNRVLTLRETLAAHRESPLCNSCHNRMDPLGLALENFNAMGMWRDQEFNEPIDPTGQLITGEEFAGPAELKRILVENHARDFYHTLAEKVLTYALGRGLEYYDVEATDRIVARIEAANGRAAALIAGVVESVPFQKMRTTELSEATEPDKSARQHAAAQRKP